MTVQTERKAFTMVSQKLAEDTRLNASDKSVALAICSFVDNTKVENRDTWASRKRICERARVSNGTLTKSLKVLEELGYIEVIPRYKRDENDRPTKERLSNVYLIKNV